MESGCLPVVVWSAGLAASRNPKEGQATGCHQSHHQDILSKFLWKQTKRRPTILAAGDDGSVAGLQPQTVTL